MKLKSVVAQSNIGMRKKKGNIVCDHNFQLDTYYQILFKQPCQTSSCFYFVLLLLLFFALSDLQDVKKFSHRREMV